MKLEKLIIFNQLPKSEFKNSILLFDRNLREFSQIKKMIKLTQFTIPLDAGENLKSLNQCEKVLLKIIQMESQHSHGKLNRIIAIGGGSVTDFAGFIASIYHRGIELVLVPTTWLAAIDSAHGGKTALNIKSFKNQIGTFYQAHRIYILKSLLKTQSKIRFFEALGEIYKIALISGGTLSKRIFSEKFNEACAMKILPSLIKIKYQIVKQDPYEKMGSRRILNLGHSCAHCFEINNKLPHGIAVWIGLFIALEMSLQKFLIKPKQYFEIKSQLLMKWDNYLKLIHSNSRISKNPKIKIQKKIILNHLLLDKKRIKNFYIDEPLIYGMGKVKLTSIHIMEFLLAHQNLMIKEGDFFFELF